MWYFDARAMRQIRAIRRDAGHGPCCVAAGRGSPARQADLMGGAEGGFRLAVHVRGGRGRSGDPKLVHSAGDRRQDRDRRCASLRSYLPLA